MTLFFSDIESESVDYETATVLYPYRAMNPDEVSKNNILVIVTVSGGFRPEVACALYSKCFWAQPCTDRSQ